MSLSKLRRQLYRAGRDLGDVEAVASGNPDKIARRALRKRVYRAEGRVTRRWLRRFGLNR